MSLQHCPRQLGREILEDVEPCVNGFTIYDGNIKENTTNTTKQLLSMRKIVQNSTATVEDVFRMCLSSVELKGGPPTVVTLTGSNRKTTYLTKSMPD